MLTIWNAVTIQELTAAELRARYKERDDARAEAAFGADILRSNMMPFGGAIVKARPNAESAAAEVELQLQLQAAADAPLEEPEPAAVRFKAKKEEEEDY